jgi:hypothetical protein
MHSRTNRLRLARLHHKHRADPLAIHLGDPAALAMRVELCDELRHDARDQGFEALIPAVFTRIELAVRLHHPAHVARPMAAQNDSLLRVILPHRACVQSFGAPHGLHHCRITSICAGKPRW